MDNRVLMKVFTLVLVTHPYLVSGQGITTCTYDLATCSAVTNKGIIYLNDATQSDPYRYSDSFTLYQYYWAPCKDFTISGTTAGALQQAISGLTYNLGVHSLAYCDVVDGVARFNMKSSDGQRFTFLQCVCGTGNTFTFETESPLKNYNFVFTSAACCPSDHGPSVVITSAVSTGTVIVIIFFSILVVYFLFGTIFQVAVKKAQGRDIVPNLGLWAAFWGLIKSGFVFTFSCGRDTGFHKI